MKISDVAQLLSAELLSYEEGICQDVDTGCGCDMMSDVLAFDSGRGLLLTGLVNPQVIRTSMMLDMSCVIFVRGKRPSCEMIKLAEENHIVLLATEYGMFESCGILYANGLRKQL